MSTIGIISAFSVGILLFMFVIWRRLKEDYPSDRVFTLCFIFSLSLVIGAIFGVVLGQKIHASPIFNPRGLWFWLSFLLLSISFLVSFNKYKFRFFETLETLGQAFLLWLFVTFLIQGIFSINVALLLFCGVIIFLIYLFYFLNKRYKNFTWYKSGKVGFSGLFVLSLFFILRVVVAIFSPDMLSFVGKFDAIVDVVAAFVFFVILFNLSGM